MERGRSTSPGESPGGRRGGRWRLEDVRIRRLARVSVGRQLEAHLARAIGEGRLEPGRRLPSTRRLAARLPVHRNTAAAVYRRLARRGLVAVSPRRRARVVGAGAGARPSGADLSPAGVASTGRVAVVAGGARHRGAVARELACRLDGAAEVVPVSLETARSGPGRLAGLRPVVEVAHLAAVRRAHPPGVPPVPLHYAPLEPVLDSVLRSGDRRRAVVLTASPAVRRDLRALTAGREGGGRIVVPGPLGRRSLQAIIGARDLVWADASRRGEAEAAARRRPHPLPLVSSRTVRELHVLLDSRARSGDTAAVGR